MISILGAGRVGQAIIKDLAEDFQSLRVVDRDPQALEAVANFPGISTFQADLSRPKTIQEHIQNADLVISAVPGSIGYQTLAEIIQAGKNVVDISFFAEDPFQLDDLARDKGVTAVVDCGVAPGLCNLIAGHQVEVWDKTLTYSCYVGGLPVIREKPYEYKAVFSPADVIEEYLRPARSVRSGKIVVHPALSGLEQIQFPSLGTLEAFHTDGLRTLIQTLPIPDMLEKTLRYPGHASLMKIFRESGFFSSEPVQVQDQSVAPLAVTSKLLFSEWQLDAGEEDLTVMQVNLTGIQDGKPVQARYDLLDRYDRDQGITSMARTTGYTCTIIARQLLKGMITDQGICPPELIGRHPDCFADLLLELEKRNIHLQVSLSG